MEELLRIHFTAHYGIGLSTVADIYLETTFPYFEIEDCNGETQISCVQGSGQAIYDLSLIHI